MLTKRQKQILDFVTDFIKDKGYSPSLEEIRRRFRLRSVSTIHEHIETLHSKGYLKKESNQPRAVEPYSSDGDIAEIPLLGYIAAGKPIEPIENPEPIEVPKSVLSKTGKHYALKVKGDSMIDEGILDKDIVVIKHQLTAEPGEIVVAVTEKGATLKIFRKRNGKIFLEPRNKNLKNIHPKKLEIRGRFCGLIRNSK